MLTITESIRTRFLSKIAQSSGCWEWQGSVYKKTGYGQFSFSHTKPVLAHRFSWVLHNGSIPDGKWVCHTCDNRVCVRPDHLFLGSPQDNFDDMRNKGRFHTEPRRGSECHFSILDEEKVRQIRQLYKRGNQGTLAEQFNVSLRTINSVCRRHTWKHV